MTLATRILIPCCILLLTALLLRYAVYISAADDLSTNLRAAAVAPNLVPGMSLYDLRAPAPLSVDFQCPVTHSADFPVTICIHNDTDLVSQCLRELGIWERPEITHFLKVMRANPDLQLLDIGAQIGVYSLTAAVLGREVVAVDPVASNIQRIHKAAHLNGVQDKITVVHNAVSSVRGIVSLFTGMGTGGASVDPVRGNVMRNHQNEFYAETKIPAITLDDLLEIIPFKRAFLKIDVEEHEPEAFKNASRLFREMDIAMVAMEWGEKGRFYHQGRNNSARDMINFFQDLGYHVFNENWKNITNQHLKGFTWDIWFVKPGSCEDCVAPHDSSLNFGGGCRSGLDHSLIPYKAPVRNYNQVLHN